MIVRASRRELLRYGSAAAAAAALPAPAIAQALAQQADQHHLRLSGRRPHRHLRARLRRGTSRRRPASRCIVENKAGASGAIAAEQVKSAPPDGYTLMWTISTTMIMNKVLFKKLPYDPDKDFVLISWMDAGHLPIIVSKNVPAKNLKEFADYARNNKVQPRHLRRGLLQPCAPSRR